MDLGIRDRRAIVCASSRGLGRACAEALAREGVHLTLNGRDATSLKEAAETIAAAHGVAVDTEAVDVVLAMNFSWQIFEQRDVLRSYFSSVRDSLVDDGVLFLDAFGGYEAYQELEEKTKHKGFTYVWEQESYDPVSGHMVCHIHFHFKDGSKMKKAFTYEWRLYGLPELKEILLDAGFSEVLPTHSGIGRARKVFGDLAKEDHPDSLEALDYLLRPLVEIEVARPAPVEDNPPITAVK